MDKTITHRYSLTHEDICKAIVEYCGGEPAEADEWAVSIYRKLDDFDCSDRFTAIAEFVESDR